MPLVNYEKHNFCSECRITYPKTVGWCTRCNHRLRTNARRKPMIEVQKDETTKR